MRVAVLLSGGKDSMLALHQTINEVVVLITAFSTNPDSYMFHSDAVSLVELQAKALGKPLIKFKTRGIKEEELIDLREAISQAKQDYNVEGVVSGAIASDYQKQRVDAICQELGLESIAPLWHRDPESLLSEVASKFQSIIVKVAADGLDKSWLGRLIDESFIRDVSELSVHPMGEGGEYESLVLDAPLFSKRLVIKDYSLEWDGVVGHLRVERVTLESKDEQ